MVELGGHPEDLGQVDALALTWLPRAIERHIVHFIMHLCCSHRRQRIHGAESQLGEAGLLMGLELGRECRELFLISLDIDLHLMLRQMYHLALHSELRVQALVLCRDGAFQRHFVCSWKRRRHHYIIMASGNVQSPIL